uniref:Secreted protein n=1 Tax=Romanomermis culicivorax TaxID=13658 RepID=A0A915IH79_ROMCU
MAIFSCWTSWSLICYYNRLNLISCFVCPPTMDSYGNTLTVFSNVFKCRPPRKFGANFTGHAAVIRLCKELNQGWAFL